MNCVFLESSDHFSFPMKYLEVIYQINGGRWGRQIRYRIFAFLTFSWENPYNFTRNGFTDLNQVVLESSDHSLILMGLLEVPHCLLGGSWGPSKSIPHFQISKLFGKIPITSREMRLQTLTGYFQKVRTILHSQWNFQWFFINSMLVIGAVRSEAVCSHFLLYVGERI